MNIAMSAVVYANARALDDVANGVEETTMADGGLEDPEVDQIRLFTEDARTVLSIVDTGNAH